MNENLGSDPCRNCTKRFLRVIVKPHEPSFADPETTHHGARSTTMLARRTDFPSPDGTGFKGGPHWAVLAEQLSKLLHFCLDSSLSSMHEWPHEPYFVAIVPH